MMCNNTGSQIITNNILINTYRIQLVLLSVDWIQSWPLSPGLLTSSSYWCQNS